MNRTVVLGSTLCLSVILMACDSGDKPPPDNEDAFARSMLLTQADFPDGWFDVEQDRVRAVDKPGGPVERCRVDDERSGLGLSPHFHQGPATATISETISVFESANAARAAFEHSDEVAACAVQAFNDGAFDDSYITVSNARFERIWADTPGDSDRVYLLSADGRIREEGEVLPFYVLLLRGSRGRIGYSLVMQLSVAPSDGIRVLFESVAHAAAARLADGASGETPTYRSQSAASLSTNPSASPSRAA